jgi:hypothetical protein
MKQEGVLGNLAWAPNRQSFTIGNNKTVWLLDFYKIHYKAIKAV